MNSFFADTMGLYIKSSGLDPKKPDDATKIQEFQSGLVRHMGGSPEDMRTFLTRSFPEKHKDEAAVFADGFETVKKDIDLLKATSPERVAARPPAATTADPRAALERDASAFVDRMADAFKKKEEAAGRTPDENLVGRYKKAVGESLRQPETMKKIFDDLGPPAATADLRKEYDALMTRARDLGAAERGPTTDDPRAARPAHTPRTTGTAPQTGDKWVDSGVAHLAKAAGISPEQYMKMKAQQLKLAPDDPKAAEKLAAAVRADVQAVQTELGAAGHPAGRYGPKKDGVDAKWGPATENAFAALRRAKGVSPTIEAIRAAAEGRPPAELGSSTEVTPPKGTVVTPPGRAAPVTRDVVSHLTFDVERLATLDLTRVGLSDTTMVTPELVASGRPVGITGMPVAGASPEEFSPMAIAAASERVAAAGSKLEWKEASLAAPVSPEAVAAGLPAKGPKGRSEMAI